LGTQHKQITTASHLNNDAQKVVRSFLLNIYLIFILNNNNRFIFIKIYNEVYKNANSKNNILMNNFPANFKVIVISKLSI